jgi:hypothetical protein
MPTEARQQYCKDADQKNAIKGACSTDGGNTRTEPANP